MAGGQSLAGSETFEEWEESEGGTEESSQLRGLVLGPAGSGRPVQARL
jgi:hypothetical protein